MSMYWIIFIGFALLSWLVSSRLQGKFEKYSKIPMPNGMTGKDVAEKMLHDNGIYDVKVISTPGHLTDHYNPANQTVNLSESVYYSNSIVQRLPFFLGGRTGCACEDRFRRTGS